MLDPDPTVKRLHGHRERQRILCLRGRVRHSGIQASTLMECVDLNRLDLRMRQVIVPHYRPDTVDCGMGPTADWVGFHVLMLDLPKLA